MIYVDGFSIGDVNFDENVSIYDAAIVLSVYAKNAAGVPVEGVSDEMLKASDIDSDGKIAIIDAAYILTYYAQTAAGMQPVWENILKK